MYINTESIFVIVQLIEFGMKTLYLYLRRQLLEIETCQSKTYF